VTRRVAAIDAGTNSTRLLVAEAPGGGSTRGPLSTLDRRMVITRLGQGVGRRGRLDPAAIGRTLDVLAEYRKVIDDLGVERVRAAATSAARDAADRAELLGPAAEIVGVELDVLTGEEEAALSFAGATAELAVDGPAALPRPYLVVDIGGGSTEVAVGDDRPTGLASVDVGCVRITEAFLHSDPPSAEELSEAVSHVRDHLADVAREVPGVRDARTLIGLAGTVSAFAAVEQGLDRYDRDRIHHFRLTRAAAEDVFRTLATEAAAERRHNPGLEPGRVDVIVGGAVVLVTVMRTFGFDEMLVSESDILDGLARSLLR